MESLTKTSKARPFNNALRYDAPHTHRTTGCLDDRLLTMMTDTGFYVP